ncbi:hypothetical protein FHS57_001116 [Runella defluvii]|uniref:Uncharacterized protein n=1 Tax=Runella defluvii TaxID=370973 RepID=A0A7W6EP95_9BACT|nr:hypothetical protein [Runella defluvii]MBB3837122.1 hypothetical protein [Runella defluvii]
MKPFVTSSIYYTLVSILFITYLSPKVFSQNIPDPNFAAAIRAACPTCIDGANNLLPPAKTLTSLDVSNKNISDLTGIGGFTVLTYFNCNDNQLTNLSVLPNTISTLWAENNSLTSISPLPTNLTYLICRNNKLTSLPTLPTGLTTFDCQNNLLTSLPNLPASLISLWCSQNNLSTLPSLPNSLSSLYANFNQITAITSFSSNLIRIHLFGNELTNLPTLPATLERIDVGSNLITSLPTLPNNLTGLFCGSNLFTQLPSLPNTLTELDCSFSLLTSLPTLPATLSKLYIDEKITCLPNIIVGLEVYRYYSPIPTPPVCGTPTCPAPVATGADICLGTSVTLTATGCSGNGAVLKWYKSANDSLAVMPVAPNTTTNYYAKCEITTNGVTCISPASNSVAVTLSTSSLLEVAAITTSVNNPVPIGSTITFKTKAMGAGPITVKWQKRGPTEAVFSDINATLQAYTSNTDVTYTTEALIVADNGVSYRAAFGSTCGNVYSTSSIIALNISQPNTTNAATVQRVKYTPSGQIADMDYSEKYGLAIAGDFDYWGINTGSLAKFDNSLDTPDTDFPRIYNIVNDVAADGAGGWFVSGLSSRGNFDSRFSINETDDPDYSSVYGIVHILADKRIDRIFKLQANANYPIDWSMSVIKRIILKGGVLYAYGDFNSRGFGPVPITNVIAINSVTGHIISFPKIIGSGDMIDIGDKLFFSASSLNTLKDSEGKGFNGLAVIDINSLKVSELNINSSVPNFFSHGPLVKSNDRLVVRFQHNQTTQAKLAVFDSMSVAPKWVIDLNNQTFTGHLTADNTTVYLLIQDTSQGTPDFLVQAIDITTGQPKSGWNLQSFRFKSTQNSTQSYPTSISINSNRLLISGLFDKVNSQTSTNVAIIDLGTNTLLNWNPEINGAVNRIKAINTTTFALSTGSLLVKSKQRKQIAFLNPISQELTSTQFSLPTLTNGLIDKAAAIAYSGDTLWVAAYSGGSTRIYGFNLIAKELINFPSIVVNGIVRKITVRDNLVYVQGDFSNANVGGQSIERKAIMVFSNTGAVQAFSINVNPSLVAHIKIHDNLVYLKGNFNSINGVVRNWFASVNRFSGALTDWNPDVVFPYQIDLTKPFEIIGNDIVFSGIVTRIGSWNNSGNSTFFVNRVTGALSKALQKGYGQTATTFESVAKEKYLFISFPNESPCAGAGTGTTYWDVEKLQYATKCLSTGVDNYNFARESTFAVNKLFASWSCSGCGKPQLLMQTTFPEGFFQGKIDYFPKVGGNVGISTIHFYGYSLGYGTRIILSKSGQTDFEIPNTSITYPEAFTAKVKIDLTGFTLGYWNIKVIYPNGSIDEISNGIEIVPLSPPNIKTEIIGPSVIRLGRAQTYTIEIKNKGEADAYLVPVWVTIPTESKLQPDFDIVKLVNNEFVNDTLFYVQVDSLEGAALKSKLYGFFIGKVGGSETFSMNLKITPLLPPTPSNPFKITITGNYPLFTPYTIVQNKFASTNWFNSQGVKCASNLIWEALDLGSAAENLSQCTTQKLQENITPYFNKIKNDETPVRIFIDWLSIFSKKLGECKPLTNKQVGTSILNANAYYTNLFNCLTINR